MRTSALAAATALLLPLVACSQTPQLSLPSFPDLNGHATESVDISLGAFPLHFVASLIDDHDGGDSAEVKRALQGVKSVQIRSYQLDADYSCSQADLASLHSQLSQPGWSRLVQAHKRDHEDVDVYVALEDQVIKGLAIIACQPREFTIVNIVGSIAPDQLVRLRRALAGSADGM